jgi:hypothetical protein
VLLEWQAYGDSTEYQVQVATDGEFAEIVVDEIVSATEYEITPALPTSTTHYWRVRAAESA